MGVPVGAGCVGAGTVAGGCVGDGALAVGNVVEPGRPQAVNTPTMSRTMIKRDMVYFLI
jgi:hypothetical protein